jgi:uncharacterized membrane protein
LFDLKKAFSKWQFFIIIFGDELSDVKLLFISTNGLNFQKYFQYGNFRYGMKTTKNPQVIHTHLFKLLITKVTNVLRGVVSKKTLLS